MIPQRLNLVLVVLVVAALTTLLLLATHLPLIWLPVGCAVFAILHFTAYCLLHEAEHGLLMTSVRWNNAAGILLGLFFPAPFFLLRQGHLGHHARNRTDTEAFDFYREGENKWIRRFQMYGTLTGIWWLVVALSPLFVLLWPLPRPFLPRDLPTQTLIRSFDPASLPWIRLQAIVVFAFHAALILGGADILGYAAFYLAAGLLWSSQQYRTPRQIVLGAKNVRTFAWLDALWLNHNWHLNHHISPQTPWTALPSVPNDSVRVPMHKAYFEMWRGPVLTNETVSDPNEGQVFS